MTHNEFLEYLHKANLSKKEFSVLTGVVYSTVGNWSNTNKVPAWVESWMENYLKAKLYDQIRSKVFEIEKIK